MVINSSNSFSGGDHYEPEPRLLNVLPLPYKHYRAANQLPSSSDESHFPPLRQRKFFHVSNKLVVIWRMHWNWGMKKKILEKSILFSQAAFRFLTDTKTHKLPSLCYLASFHTETKHYTRTPTTIAYNQSLRSLKYFGILVRQLN